MRTLSFIAAGELFAADVTQVQMVARRLPVTPVPGAPPAVMGIANLRGRVVTILNIAALLGGTRAAAPRAVNAVIFKPFGEPGDQMGLQIDTPGELVVLDNVLPPPDPDAAAGGLICGVAEKDGKLYRLLDVSSVSSRFGGAAAAGI